MTHPAKTPAAARGRRLLRELGAALVLVVALVVLVFGQRWHRARLEVAAAVAEADRLDPGWRFEDMEARRRLPPPEGNSALQVLKVKSLLPRRWPTPPLGPKDEDTPERQAWLADPPPGKLDHQARQIDPRHMRMLRDALARARPALAEARKLADMPGGRYPITWSADVYSTPCPWEGLRYEVATLLEFDGLVRNQDGDSDGALAGARALVNLGRSLGEEPFGSGPRDRTACRNDAVATVGRALAQGQPSEAALALTQQAIREEDAVPLTLPHFRGQRAITHLFLADVDDGRHRLSEWG